MSAVQVAGNRKKVAQEDADIISNLPLDVTQRILGCLPLQEAVRTSVLSSQWKYKWVVLPTLILDETFFSSVLRGQPSGSSKDLLAYSNIVQNILLRHAGPIHKLELCIPEWFPKGTDISHWVQFVSCNGDVKELVLKQPSRGPILKRKVPSCLFSSVGLTHLTLINFSAISFPRGFRGFPCLVKLLLHIRSTSGGKEANKVETLVNSCPQLKSLDLRLDEPTSLTIQAPMIQHLVVSGSLTKVCLQGTTMIKTLTIGIQWKRKEDFISLCNSVLDLEKLTIMWSLSKTRRPWKFETFENLASELGRLKTLELNGVELLDDFAISHILCLLRSSPQLQKLSISGFESEENQPLGLTYNHCSLQNLKHVEFTYVEGLSAGAMELIQILLACSPVLVVMTVHLICDYRVPEEKLDMAKKLMRFRRASTNAELILRT